MNIPNVGEDEEQLKGSYTARVLTQIQFGKCLALSSKDEHHGG